MKPVNFKLNIYRRSLIFCIVKAMRNQKKCYEQPFTVQRKSNFINRLMWSKTRGSQTITLIVFNCPIFFNKKGNSHNITWIFTITIYQCFSESTQSTPLADGNLKCQLILISCCQLSRHRPWPKNDLFVNF